MYSFGDECPRKSEAGGTHRFPGRRGTWGLVIVALCLQAFLIWSRRYPPLIDYPNHMARHYYESLWLRGVSTPTWYRIDYHLLPNLGGDIVIPLLMVFLSPHIAGKVFLTASVFVYWMGGCVYIRQIARTGPGISPAALLLLPFVIDGSFCWGFLNYYSGIGLAFLTLAHQDRLIRQRTNPRFELAFHAFCVSALFVWHLAVWVIYGSLAACRIALEVCQGLRDPSQERGGSIKVLSRPAAVAAAVIPSVLLFFQ